MAKMRTLEKNVSQRDKGLSKKVLLIAAFVVVFFCSLLLLFYIISGRYSTQNEALYVSTASSVNSVLTAYSTFCDTIASSDTILDYISNDIPQVYMAAITGRQLAQELNQTSSLSSISGSSIAVIFPVAELVVTPSQYYLNASGDYFMSNYFGSTITMDDIYANTDGSWGTIFEDENCWIIRRVHDVSSAYIVVRLRLSDLCPTDEDAVVLIGNDEELIFSNLSSVSDELYFELLAKLSSVRNFTLSGKRYYAVTSLHSNIAVNVIVGVKYNSALKAFLMSLLIVSGIAALVILIYLGIRKIMSRPTAGAAVDDQFEISYLDSLTMGQHLQLILGSSGEASVEYSKALLNIIGIDPERGCFVLGIACADDPSGIFDLSSSPDVDREAITPFFVINNVLNDTLLSDHKGALCAYSEYCILILECLDGEICEQISKSLEQFSNLVREALGLGLAITEPIYVEGLGLRTPLEATVNRVTYLAFWYPDRHNTSGNTEDTSEAFWAASRNVIKAIENRNYAEAKELFNELLDGPLLTEIEDVNIVRARLESFVGILLSVTGLRLKKPETDKTSLNNVASVRNSCLEILDSLDQDKPIPATSSSSILVSKTKKYVEENYSDPSLNVSSIAGYFEINMAYLSRIFKEITGVNLLEYIHRTRVSAAKELLQTHSVKDTSALVGFGEMQSFVRIFKKYVGVTPAEYKKSNPSV